MAAGKTPSLTGESVGGTLGVSECTYTHAHGNQHQKGTVGMWIVGKVTESGTRDD